MPTSNFRNISAIMRLIVGINPMSVLDVGIGFGKYGFPMREYLELWDGREKYGRSNWQRTIHGIEVCEDYIDEIQLAIYDHIYIGEALEELSKIARAFDLILLIDVLEHFYKDGGFKLLNRCKEKTRNIIICVPAPVRKQGAAFGNPYERHISKWDHEDFKKAFSEYTNIAADGHLIWWHK